MLQQEREGLVCVYFVVVDTCSDSSAHSYAV